MLKYAKITNEKTKEVSVGLGTDTSFYQSIGMLEIDVEESYDGKWYLVGYAPQQSTEEQNEAIRSTRASFYKSEVDTLMAEYNRKKLFNLFADGEEETLKSEISAKVAEIKEQNPYVTEA